jgi:hypothetical protein
MIVVPSLQIAITAVLGCDSYIVMRHGACPGTSGGTDEVAAQIENLCTEDALGHQRLGCCFCNDAASLFNVHQIKTCFVDIFSCCFCFIPIVFLCFIIGPSCSMLFFCSQFLMEQCLVLPQLHLAKQWSSLLGCYIILMSKMP